MHSNVTINNVSCLHFSCTTRTFSTAKLVMIQCQQIASAIRMILEEAKRARKPAGRKTGTSSDRWKIMPISDQTTGLFFICLAKYCIGYCHNVLSVIVSLSLTRVYCGRTGESTI